MALAWAWKRAFISSPTRSRFAALTIAGASSGLSQPFSALTPPSRNVQPKWRWQLPLLSRPEHRATV